MGATSLMANQRRLDALSNNLGNINTLGYKKVWRQNGYIYSREKDYKIIVS